MKNKLIIMVMMSLMLGLSITGCSDKNENNESESTTEITTVEMTESSSTENAIGEKLKIFKSKDEVFLYNFIDDEKWVQADTEDTIELNYDTNKINLKIQEEKKNGSQLKTLEDYAKKLGVTETDEVLSSAIPDWASKGIMSIDNKDGKVTVYIFMESDEEYVAYSMIGDEVIFGQYIDAFLSNIQSLKVLK